VSEKRSFFAELKRRNFYKVAVAYAIVGWLLIQIATQVFPFLKIPNWIVRLVIRFSPSGDRVASLVSSLPMITLSSASVLPLSSLRKGGKFALLPPMARKRSLASSRCDRTL
jgi:hypothetical protein